MITSTPWPSAKTGQTYRYPITATDPDGDVLTYRIFPAVSGVSLSGTELVWTPSSAGTQELTIEVSDGAKLTRQTWTVTVLDSASHPLRAALTLEPRFVAPGAPVQYRVGVENAGSPPTFVPTRSGKGFGRMINQLTKALKSGAVSENNPMLVFGFKQLGSRARSGRYNRILDSLGTNEGILKNAQGFIELAHEIRAVLGVAL